MFTLMALLGLMFFGAAALVAVVAMAVMTKLFVHVALLPLKLILFPIFAILLVVKLAIVVAIGAVLLAVFIPVAILLALVIGPLFLAGAVFG
jgi:hypothetical protein